MLIINSFYILSVKIQKFGFNAPLSTFYNFDINHNKVQININLFVQNVKLMTKMSKSLNAKLYTFAYFFTSV